MAKATQETKVSEQTYTKEPLVRSERYMKRRDLLNALLDSGRRYTFTQVDAMIENFMKGKVK